MTVLLSRLTRADNTAQSAHPTTLLSRLTDKTGTKQAVGSPGKNKEKTRATLLWRSWLKLLCFSAYFVFSAC